MVDVLSVVIETEEGRSVVIETEEEVAEEVALVDRGEEAEEDRRVVTVVDQVEEVIEGDIKNVPN
jgi:hypothetical protein